VGGAAGAGEVGGGGGEAGEKWINFYLRSVV